MGALVCLVATRCYGAAGFLTKRWVADKAGLDAKLVAFGSQIGATDLPRPSLRRAVWRDVLGEHLSAAHLYGGGLIYKIFILRLPIFLTTYQASL